MLSPRQAQLAFVPLMSLVMSGAISLVMTGLHGSTSKGFLGAWLSGWMVAFMVALPVALVVVPAVRGMLSNLTRMEEIPSTGEKIPEAGQ